MVFTAENQWSALRGHTTDGSRVVGVGGSAERAQGVDLRTMFPICTAQKYIDV